MSLLVIEVQTWAEFVAAFVALFVLGVVVNVLGLIASARRRPPASMPTAHSLSIRDNSENRGSTFDDDR